MAQLKQLRNRNNISGKDCKDCTKRHIGCHATCELYINNKAKSLEMERSIDVKRKHDQDIEGHERKVARKMEKARNVRGNY